MSLLRRIRKHRKSDPSYAHVLLHSHCNIYYHTPYPTRAERLKRYEKEFPELVKQCLESCSQTGREDK